jgi:hypothetical protein
MRLARPTGRLNRRAALALLGILLTTAALSLSQCRMVQENLTGVSLDRTKPSKCVEKCSKTLAQKLLVETTQHANRLRDCAGDPVCAALENARHEQALASIYASYRSCLDDCHHQGSGGGGR